MVHLLYRWLIWKSRGTKGNDTCWAPLVPSRSPTGRPTVELLWGTEPHRARCQLERPCFHRGDWGSGSGFLLPEAGYSKTTAVAGLVQGGSAPESRKMLGASGLCDEVMDTTTPDRQTTVTKV